MYPLDFFLVTYSLVQVALYVRVADAQPATNYTWFSETGFLIGASLLPAPANALYGRIMVIVSTFNILAS
jgi:hypothetical protein